MHNIIVQRIYILIQIKIPFLNKEAQTRECEKETNLRNQENLLAN